MWSDPAAIAKLHRQVVAEFPQAEYANQQCRDYAKNQFA
jgi:hypothetical protein